MLNYKDCSFQDFEKAMKEKDCDLKTISESHLYILYTKFKADATQCFNTGTSYSNALGVISKNKAEIYKKELERRGVNIF